MKTFDILLFSFIGILILFGFISILIIRSDGGKCISNPIIYGLKDIELNNDGVAECVCSHNNQQTTYYNSTSSKFIGKDKFVSKEYYYVNLDELVNTSSE